MLDIFCDSLNPLIIAELFKIIVILTITKYKTISSKSYMSVDVNKQSNFPSVTHSMELAKWRAQNKRLQRNG